MGFVRNPRVMPPTRDPEANAFGRKTKQIISTGLHSDGDSRLIHISAVTAGYANVLGWTQGLTFYVDGLTNADAHCEKVSMLPCHSIVCTRSSRRRRSWPSSCARLNNRRPSPEKPLVLAISSSCRKCTGIINIHRT